MAEVIGLAASIIAVTELVTKTIKLCYEYSGAVGSAKKDIRRIRRRLKDLDIILRAFEQLEKKEPSLKTSHHLASRLDDCYDDLDHLSRKIDPGARRTLMSRSGFRALTWPLKSKDADRIARYLDYYLRIFSCGLQIDGVEILIEIKQGIARLSRLNNDPSIVATPQAYFHAGLSQDPDFVDRPDIMGWMKNQFEGPQNRMALRGLGGLGKSQLANHFAYQIHSDSPQTSVFWIHASTKPRLLESYRSIADTLEIPGRSNPEANVLALVQNWLEKSKNKWLLVLDSADDISVFYPASKASHSQRAQAKSVGSFLPNTANGTILITTRSREVASRLTRTTNSIYHIETMDETQASLLLRNKLSYDFEAEDEAVIRKLVHSLGYIPLAISQAAAYINRRASFVSPRSYLKRFNKSKKSKTSLLNQDAGDLQRDESVSNSVVVTWQVTFDQIRRESPTAVFLLSFLSFFNPQGIPRFALHGVKLSFETRGGYNARAVESESVLNDALIVLQDYSLVSISRKGRFIELHPLVQLCTQSWMSSNGEMEKFRRTYLRVMNNKFRQRVNKNMFQFHQLIPHLEWVVKEIAMENASQDQLQLAISCAQYYYNIGHYVPAENLGKKIVIILDEFQRRSPGDLVRILNIIMIALHDQGASEEAVEFGLKATNISTRELGDKHYLTANSHSLLASCYLQLGRNQDAEELAQWSAGIIQDIYGAEAPETLDAWVAVGEIYQRQGRTRDAINLIKSALKNHNSSSTTGRICMARGTRVLGKLFREQGKYEESEDSLQHALSEYRKLCGDDHNSTILTMCQLAHTLEKQGRLEEAIVIQRTAVRGNERVFGPHHKYTIGSREDLAYLEDKMRR